MKLLVKNKEFRKTGQELFLLDDLTLDFKLLDFWSWSQSNLLDNTLRGVLAEFIVAQALGNVSMQRIEWEAFDLITHSGLKIEVKSSAYLQSWKQKKVSDIVFGIRPTKGWNAELNEYADTITRQADVYVFCLLHHKDKETINPLNLDQWTFYVLETKVLNEKCEFQKTIKLSSLLKLNPVVCQFKDLKNTIQEVNLQTNEVK